MPARNARTTVNTTKTTTSTASKIAAGRRPARIHAQPSVIQQAAAFWSTMTGDQKNSYTAPCAQVANSRAPAMPPRTTAYKTFVALSAANIAAGLPLQAVAHPYAPAAALPAMQLIASYVNNSLTLTLVPSAPYPHPIALKGAIPMLAGANAPGSKSFKKLGGLPALSAPIDITSLYLAHYRVPGTGYKVALEVMGVAPGGYHTDSLYVFGVVSNVAAEETLFNPTTQPLTLQIG